MLYIIITLGVKILNIKREKLYTPTNSAYGTRSVLTVYTFLKIGSKHAITDIGDSMVMTLNFKASIQFRCIYECKCGTIESGTRTTMHITVKDNDALIAELKAIELDISPYDMPVGWINSYDRGFLCHICKRY